MAEFGRPSASQAVTLTRQQAAVVRLLAAGLSIKRAAAALGMSFHTANGHTREAMRRLGVHSRGELIIRALQDGHAALPPPRPPGRAGSVQDSPRDDQPRH